MTEGATEEDRMKVREKVFELIKKRKMKVSSKTYITCSWPPGSNQLFMISGRP